MVVRSSVVGKAVVTQAQKENSAPVTLSKTV